MTKKSKDFRKQYEYSYEDHPIRKKAIDNFNKNNDFSTKKKARLYIYQVMATIGLELESRFDISFNDDGFKLFGREKSQKSISDKKENNIHLYDVMFENALENGEELPTEVRPIFDFYAFKFVCPEVKDTKKVLVSVVKDILDYIDENYPAYAQQILEMRKAMDVSLFVPIDYLDRYFSDKFPNLKAKIVSVLNEQEYANTVQSFLDKCPKDVSELTYSDYYSKIIECYNILLKLSYEESKEETDRIVCYAEAARKDFTNALENGYGHSLIDDLHYDELNKKLQTLLNHVSEKRTNKVDLSLANLMIFDILTTSKELKSLGVDYSKDPTRTKKKRNPNGYIADFFSLDMPNGLMSEIQLQSLYRYNYGETGPAAHHLMANGTKKRNLLPRPKDKEKYPEWAEKQFKSLPRFFLYKDKGYVEVFSTLKNFRQYYKCKDNSKVQTYVNFIASHDVDLLEGKFYSFSLGEPSLLQKQEKDKTTER